MTSEINVVHVSQIQCNALSNVVLGLRHKLWSHGGKNGRYTYPMSIVQGQQFTLGSPILLYYLVLVLLYNHVST